jgi:hypothetical protein
MARDIKTFFTKLFTQLATTQTVTACFKILYFISFAKNAEAFFNISRSISKRFLSFLS